VAYRIEIERRAQKELSHLPKAAQDRLVAAIGALAETPRPRGSKPVQAAPKGTYRIRVGDYRVIYVVVDDNEVIIIARIARRNESTYRDL
jgi:mRNA interferase RelE/StbE